MICTRSRATGNKHDEEGLDVDSPRLWEIIPFEAFGASKIAPQNVSLNEYEALK